MHDIHSHPSELFYSAWYNRCPIRALISPEVFGRCRSVLPVILWYFFNLQFIQELFTCVISDRWNAKNDSKVEFILLLFAGLIIFNIFAECLNRASRPIPRYSYYLNNILFTLKTPLWNALGAAGFYILISVLFFWLKAYLVLFAPPNGTHVFSPIVWLPFILFLTEPTCMLASLGVYLSVVTFIPWIGVAEFQKARLRCADAL